MRSGGSALRRAPLLVVSGAVAGFAGLVGWHSFAPAAGPGTPAAGTGPAGTLAPAAAGSATPSGRPARRGAGRRGAAGAGPRGAAAPVRTATGRLVSFGYGTIAVRVTVRGTQIIAASVATLTTLEPTSQQISAQAIPVLHSEVLAAHSARINGVSGATYTSEGYYQSLQAALRALHAG